MPNELKLGEVELVLNVEFGGFSLDYEMAAWLRDNRGWTICSESDPPVKGKSAVGGTFGGVYWPFVDKEPVYSSAHARVDPDLVACVKALQQLHADEKDDHAKKRRRKVWSLRVFRVTTAVTVRDLHDGKETVEPLISVDEAD
jgi:hypothetical protein